MDYDIKNCPHCGGVAHLESNFYIPRYKPMDVKYFVFVKCYSCKAQSGTKNTPVSPETNGWSDFACQCVVDEWNLRYDERKEKE